MLECKDKFLNFNKLIDESNDNKTIWSFDAKSFSLEHVNCFSIYINEKFFKKNNDDFKYSLGIILKESILNGFYHGNFNIDSRIKDEEDGFKKFNEIVNQKIKENRYSLKKIKVTLEISENKIILSVEDEGKGFDYKKYKPQDNAFYGRGIKLIKLNCDRVTWNKKGNKIIMEKAVNG